MLMQNWFHKTRELMALLIIPASIAIITLLALPQMAHAQSSSDWQFQLERFRVVQAQEDDFWEDGDEPYFIVIQFGARYQESGSAFVSWSRYLEEDWASGVDDNDERAIPFEMGAVSYTNMEMITRDHYECDNVMPEGGGALVIAMEHDNTPWSVIRDIMDDLQLSLETELTELIADGNLDVENAEQDVRDAVERIVSSISYDFWRSAEIVALSAGFPDDFINYHVFIFGAAYPHVKSELEIPALSQATVDVFNDRQFDPIVFEGDDAKYEVSSSLLPTLRPQISQISNLEIEQPAQTVVGVPIDFQAIIGQGSDVIFDWDWGDGTTGICANASHVYDSAGSYDIVVKASNSSSVETRTINVNVTSLPPQVYLPNLFWSDTTR